MNDWENIALYLADCQAATTEHLALLKSASKSDLRRHASICQFLLRALDSGYMSERARNKPEILDRLRVAVRNATEKIG